MMRFSISPSMSRRASASSWTAAMSASGEGAAGGTGWVVRVVSIAVLGMGEQSSELVLALGAGGVTGRLEHGGQSSMDLGVEGVHRVRVEQVLLRPGPFLALHVQARQVEVQR